MSPSGTKRRKTKRSYELVIIPHGEAGHIKSFTVGGPEMALGGGALLVVFFLIYFLVFRYTPLGVVVGADPSLRARIDSVENGTQRRLVALSEEIAVLKDYNLKLRKALGERLQKPVTTSTPSEETPVDRAPEQQRPMQVPGDEQYAEDFSSPAPATQLAVSTEGLKAPFPLIMPVNGIVSRGFDPTQRHYGVDVAARIGTSVFAAAPGYVMFAGWTYEDGNVIMLSHGPAYVTVYKHNSTLLKSTGAYVRRGEVIALVGNTGVTSKGPHLHFEVLKDGVPQDPQTYLLTPARRRRG